MPILELKSFEKIPKKKPFKFLSGVFRRGASQELEITEDMLYGTDRELSPRPLTPAGHLDIEEEMENLHLSRRDNPYLSSCEALDDCEEGSLSPGPGSPRQSSLSPPVSSEAVSPPSYQTIVELHSHLVRSPPPVHWPVKVEEGADFGSCRELSPGSGGGSVERLAGLSPFSPVRGQTPAVSPARGQTPEHTVSSPSQEGERPVVGGVGGQYRAYSRSISQSSTRLRSKTPDEEFSPSRFVATPHHLPLLTPVFPQVQYLRSPPARLDRPQPEQQVQVVLPGDLPGQGLCVQLPASQPEVSGSAGLLIRQVRREHQQQEVQHGPLHLLAPTAEENPLSDQTRREVHGKLTISLSVLWQYQVRRGWRRRGRFEIF